METYGESETEPATGTFLGGLTDGISKELNGDNSFDVANKENGDEDEEIVKENNVGNNFDSGESVLPKLSNRENGIDDGRKSSELAECQGDADDERNSCEDEVEELGDKSGGEDDKSESGSSKEDLIAEKEDSIAEKEDLIAEKEDSIAEKEDSTADKEESEHELSQEDEDVNKQNEEDPSNSQSPLPSDLNQQDTEHDSASDKDDSSVCAAEKSNLGGLSDSEAPLAIVVSPKRRTQPENRETVPPLKIKLSPRVRKKRESEVNSESENVADASFVSTLTNDSDVPLAKVVSKRKSGRPKSGKNVASEESESENIADASFVSNDSDAPLAKIASRKRSIGPKSVKSKAVNKSRQKSKPESKRSPRSRKTPDKLNYASKSERKSPRKLSDHKMEETPEDLISNHSNENEDHGKKKGRKRKLVSSESEDGNKLRKIRKSSKRSIKDSSSSIQFLSPEQASEVSPVVLMERLGDVRHPSSKPRASSRRDSRQIVKPSDSKRNQDIPEDDAIKRLKKSISAAGLRIRNYGTFYSGCRSTKDKVKKLRKFLDDHGLKDPSKKKENVVTEEKILEEKISEEKISEADQIGYIKIESSRGSLQSTIHTTLVKVCGATALSSSKIAATIRRMKRGRLSKKKLSKYKKKRELFEEFESLNTNVILSVNGRITRSGAQYENNTPIAHNQTSHKTSNSESDLAEESDSICIKLNLASTSSDEDQPLLNKKRKRKKKLGRSPNSSSSDSSENVKIGRYSEGPSDAPSSSQNMRTSVSVEHKMEGDGKIKNEDVKLDMKSKSTESCFGSTKHIKTATTTINKSSINNQSSAVNKSSAVGQSSVSTSSDEDQPSLNKKRKQKKKLRRSSNSGTSVSSEDVNVSQSSASTSSDEGQPLLKKKRKQKKKSSTVDQSSVSTSSDEDQPSLNKKRKQKKKLRRSSNSGSSVSSEGAKVGKSSASTSSDEDQPLLKKKRKQKKKSSTVGQSSVSASSDEDQPSLNKKRKQKKKLRRSSNSGSSVSSEDVNVSQSSASTSSDEGQPLLKKKKELRRSSNSDSSVSSKDMKVSQSSIANQLSADCQTSADYQPLANHQTSGNGEKFHKASPLKTTAKPDILKASNSDFKKVTLTVNDDVGENFNQIDLPKVHLPIKNKSLVENQIFNKVKANKPEKNHSEKRKKMKAQSLKTPNTNKENLSKDSLFALEIDMDENKTTTGKTLKKPKKNSEQESDVESNFNCVIIESNPSERRGKTEKVLLKKSDSNSSLDSLSSPKVIEKSNSKELASAEFLSDKNIKELLNESPPSVDDLEEL